jgi:subtilisin family serine protease
LTAVLAWLGIGACLWGFSGLCLEASAESIALLKGPVEPGCFRLDYEDNRLSLKANDAPVGDVLAEIGHAAHIEVGVDSRVEGTVTATFQGLPLEEAIKAIAKNWGMVFVKKNGTDHVIQVVVPTGSPHGLSTSNNGFGLANAQTPAVNRQPAVLPQANAQVQAVPGTTPAKRAKVARFVPGELLVRFKRHMSQHQITQILAGKDATVKRGNAKADYFVLSLPEQWPVPEAAAWLQSQGVVEFAEPNYLIPIAEIPNDERYAEQWALDNIEAEAGWDLETGSPDVVIAVIDTGVDWQHPDLAANIWRNTEEDWGEVVPGELEPGNNGIDDDGNGFIDDYRGWDFVSAAPSQVYSGEDPGPPDNDPMDFQGHGTHVAGIAGAVTNNEIGIAGLAWHCSIMAVRAGYEEGGENGVLEVDDAADAIRYAVDNGAGVLNLSWGDDGDYTLIREAVTYAAQKGLIVCAAAGNDGDPWPFFPAAYGDPDSDPPADPLIDALVVAVGSTDSSDGKAGSSNYGDWVDIFAPGMGILSTCVGGGYCTKSGTSMAAPHVAGLAGLLLSRFAGWSSLTITYIVLGSVRVVEGLAGQNAPSGIIDLYESLDVDAQDLAFLTQILADHFGRADCSNPDPCQGDLDGDGDVDGSDLAGLLRY